MEAFRYHVFICDQKKAEGVPGCNASGSERVIDALRRELGARRLMDEVQVTVCGSLGVCERGPNMVVYPEGIWYSGLTPQDVPEIVEKHFQQGQVVERLVNRDAAALAAEIRSNRDKYLAALRAKDAAGALPDDLQEKIRGFQESRVILTAIELDVFSAVGSSAGYHSALRIPHSALPGARAADVAAKIGADARATEMLLNALVAIGLLTKQGEVVRPASRRQGPAGETAGTEGAIYQNTPVAARYFIEGAPDDARAALMHTVHLWQRWSTLSDCVRAGTSVTYREAADRGDHWTRAFIAAMHRNAAERAPHVVRAVGTSGIERMLDVGGGSGAYSIAFATAGEKLRVELLDLPAVCKLAQGYIEKAGLSGRITTRTGDLRTDDLGSGYDLVFVSAICHMLDERENLDLIERCRKALKPGGRLVIQDFILEPDKTAPKSAALFSLNMLVGTKHGASYSDPEYAVWMREAGFANVARVRLPGPSGLMIATRV
jgi:(2Fe-2S) ferredoxin/predicted O-methyltransferase YrrM